MSLIDQEATMSDQAFDQIAAIAISDAGLSIPRSKKALVQSRLDRRLRALRLDTVKDYIELLMIFRANIVILFVQSSETVIIFSVKSGIG